MTDKNSSLDLKDLQSDPDPLISDFYIMGETIGEGTFGKVKKALHILTKEKVAIKILQKSKIREQSDIDRIARELNILQHLKHPNVILLYDIVETKQDLYIVMEYASNGELFNYILQKKRLSEPEACKFFQQIIDGIEYIHKNFIVHRDLKPENLLLDSNNNLKIIDFGLGNEYIKGGLLKTACGSPCYAAPEMLQGIRYQGLFTDIWSSGVILFTMICGYLPFEDPNTDELYRKIIEGRFEIPDDLSEDAKDLLRNILRTDPKKRFNIAKIKAHRWFNLCHYKEKEGFMKKIDEEVMKKIKGMGLDEKKCRSFIMQNEHNFLSASYYLILQKKLRKEEHIKNFLETLRHFHKIKRGYSCPKKLLYEPTIFDVYFYHTIHEKIFISAKSLSEESEEQKERIINETLWNVEALAKQPIIVESNLENLLDSTRNLALIDKKLQKIKQTAQMNKVLGERGNLYDKYKEKNQKKMREKFKFSSPSPRKTNKNNSQSPQDSLKKRSFKSPEKQGNERIYKIFNENSSIMKKISNRIKNPLSKQMKAKNMQLFYRENTEIFSGLSLKTTATPSKTKDYDKNEGISKENTKEMYEQNEGTSKENRKEIYAKTQEKVKNKEKTTINERKKKVNNSFHFGVKVNENRDKSKKNGNYNNFHSDDENELIENSFRIQGFQVENELLVEDFSSVTSQDPQIMMKRAENALKELNYTYKYNGKFHLIFEKTKGIKGEIMMNSLKGYDELYMIKFIPTKSKKHELIKYKSVDLTKIGFSSNCFVFEFTKILKAMKM